MILGRTRSRSRDRGHGTVPQFLPWQVSGLLGMFRGDLGIPGAAVSAWANQAPGQSWTLAQATGTAQPAYSATGGPLSRPCVTFDGGDGLASSAQVELATFSILAVWKQSVAGMLYEHSANANVNAGCYLYGPGGNTIVVTRGGGPTMSSYTRATLGDDTWRITTHDYGGTHATHTLRFNGVAQAPTSITANDPGTGAATATLYVGARGAASSHMTGRIAELLVYTPVLSTTDRARVEAYLSRRYGIALG